MTDVKSTRKHLKIQIGDSFSRWTVTEYAGRDKWGSPVWKCRCECGTEKNVDDSGLKRGSSKSCGCFNSEQVAKRRTTHGMASTSEWQAWKAMKRRCHKKTLLAKHYRDRGITVCERWRNSFENFYADMGPKPTPKHSIDRIDVNGNYELSNCRWATWKEQANNKRNNLPLIEHNGKSQAMIEWSKELGIKMQTIYARFKKGWTIERALSIRFDARKT